MGKRLCEVSDMCTSRRRCSNNRPNQSKRESLMMMMIPYVKASDHQEGMMKCRNQIHVMQHGSKAVTFLCTDQAELKFYFKSKGKLGFCTVEKPARRRGQQHQHPMSVCINSDPCNKKLASSILHAKFEAADGEAASHGMCPRNKISYELCAPEDQNLNINLNTQDQVCSPQHCTNVKVCTGETGVEMNLNMQCMDTVNPKIELPMTALKMEILKNAKINAPPPPFITT